MLVLSRKEGETLQIGDDVSITVVEIRGDKVRLGIEAPGSIAVDRREVRLAKERSACTGASSESSAGPNGTPSPSVR